MGIVVFTSRAARENTTANVQRISDGVITQCERGSREGIYCSYMFAVGEDQYIGSSSASSFRPFGETVTVYFDADSPEINALESFGEQARRDRDIAYALLLAVGVLVVVNYPAGATWGLRRSAES